MNLNSLKFEINISEKEFTNFINKHSSATLYQNPAWGQVKDSWQTHKTAIYYENNLIGVALMLIRPLPIAQKIAYIPKGPLINSNINDIYNEEILTFYLKKLKEFAKKEKAFMLKIDFFKTINTFYYKEYKNLIKEEKKALKNNNLEQISLIQDKLNKLRKKSAYQLALESQNLSLLKNEDQKLISSFLNNNFKHKGFLKNLDSTIQPRFIATIKKKDWEIFDRSTLKYELNIANKSFLDVRILNGLDLKNNEDLKNKVLNDFCKCIASTEKRQNINLRNKEYYQKIIDAYAEQGFIQITYCHLDKLYFNLRENLKKLEIELETTTSNKKIKKLKEDASALEKRLIFLHPLFLKAQEQNNFLIPTAGNLFIASGEKNIEMLYAGTEINFSKYFAQYLAYTHSFDYFFEKGYENIILGGLSGDLNDGLAEFKGQFNCLVEEQLGEWDATLKPLNNYLFYFALNLRKKLKKLFKKNNK